MFAQNYLAKHGATEHAESPVPANLGMVVVIPCYNEPELFSTLESLLQTDPPSQHTEVLIVVNDGEHDNETIQMQNLKTLQQCKGLQSISDHISVQPLYFDNLPKKYAGAGLARKIGMDQAIGRFNKISKADGILISLDADTRVEKNYLTEIEKTFQQSETTVHGCNIHFEHPLSGVDHEINVYTAITLYELRLRYYKNALRFTGFPYAYHTVGSCFAVRAETYAKQGGMNKRQGGEDFYFLNKIFPLGSFKEISTTTVYPSPRPSNRVPFGTGPSIQKYIEDPLQLGQFYSFALFLQLKQLFSTIQELYQQEGKCVEIYLNQLPQEIRQFLSANDFVDHIHEINNNVASVASFRHRFFHYFNAFKVVKFLNATFSNQKNKNDLISEAQSLLAELQIRANETARDLLKIYRKIDKKEINPLLPQ